MPPAYCQNVDRTETPSPSSSSAGQSQSTVAEEGKRSRIAAIDDFCCLRRQTASPFQEQRHGQGRRRIGKVESQQSVFNRLGASPKEVKKSVHERLGPVPIIKKHTNSPLGVEPSKEFKSVVPSRMRREADVNVLCGKVLEGRPKITVHTSVQEENEESMESSYATYQSGQDVEVPQELEGWKLAGRACLPGYTELGSLLHANLSIGKASLIQIKGLPI
nr:uncharacterized protein LOC109150426 [Ipomoea batatas]